MAVVSDGKTYGRGNPNLTVVTSGDTPASPGTGQLIWDGTNLKINVGTEISPTWKTITVS